MKENEKVVLFDLDGTLADYQGQLFDDLSKIFGDEEAAKKFTKGEKASMSQVRGLITRQHGWWASLPKIPLGMKIYKYFHDTLGFKCMVLTKGPRTKFNAWGEKVEWVRGVLDSDVDITITEDKGLVYGKVLVDDWPKYITRWLEWRPRGIVLMPAHDYNKDFEHPNVIRVSEDNLAESLNELNSRLGIGERYESDTLTFKAHERLV